MEATDLDILIVLGVIGLVWLLPIFLIVTSSKTTGSEKFAWVLLILFVSWFAWIFYLLLAPIKKRE